MRSIPLSEVAQHAAKELIRIKEKRGNRSKFLVGSRESIRVNTFMSSRQWLRQVRTLEAALKEAGVRLKNCSDLTPHVFRHSFATNYLIKTKGSFRTAVLALQKFMGHASIETTMGYVHLIESESENSVNSLDAIFDEPSEPPPKKKKTA